VIPPVKQTIQHEHIGLKLNISHAEVKGLGQTEDTPSLECLAHIAFPVTNTKLLVLNTPALQSRSLGHSQIGGPPRFVRELELKEEYRFVIGRPVQICDSPFL